MADLTLWHNPRCLKSRAALTLLRERGIEPGLRLYIADPPGEAELRDLLGRLGLPAADVVRRREAAFRTAGLPRDADDAEYLALMARHPILIERPILVSGDRAVIGRPPERVLELL